MMKKERLHNPSAGDILLKEFLEELRISPVELSKETGISLIGINKIITGEWRLTKNLDIKLCKFFGLSEGYFLRLQKSYEEADENNTN